MRHVLEHLEHFFSSFLGSKEYWAALIGAVIGGLLTGRYALRAQKQAAKDQQIRDEKAERRTVEGILLAIATELKVLKEDTLDDLNRTLQDRAQRVDSGPLMMRRVKQNRAAVFQSNANMIGRISNDDLRRQIVRVYGLIAGMLDYTNTMAQDYELWRSLSGQPDENRELLDKLRELESHLRNGVQVLQREIPPTGRQDRQIPEPLVLPPLGTHATGSFLPRSRY